MSRTVYYDTRGNEIEAEYYTNDVPTYAQEQLVNHLEYDTRAKNVIKEINNIRNIACGVTFENENGNINMGCENCPFYSSVHGCRFDYVNNELEYIYRK